MSHVVIVQIELENLEDLEQDRCFGEKLRTAIQAKNLRPDTNPEVYGMRGKVAEILEVKKI